MIMIFIEPERMAEIFDEHRRLTFEDVIKRDDRRFKVADHNKDGKLTKDEYGDFTHPEDVPHMRDVVIEVSTVILPVELL